MKPRVRYAVAWLLFVGALASSIALLTYRGVPQAEATIYPTTRLQPTAKMVAFERWAAPGSGRPDHHLRIPAGMPVLPPQPLGATLAFDPSGAVHIVAQSTNAVDAMANANAVADSYVNTLNANGGRYGTFTMRPAGLPGDGMARRLIAVIALSGGMTVCGVYLVRSTTRPGPPHKWQPRPGYAV